MQRAEKWKVEHSWKIKCEVVRSKYIVHVYQTNAL